jgi:hypothetical protein
MMSVFEKKKYIFWKWSGKNLYLESFGIYTEKDLEKFFIEKRGSQILLSFLSNPNVDPETILKIMEKNKDIVMDVFVYYYLFSNPHFNTEICKKINDYYMHACLYKNPNVSIEYLDSCNFPKEDRIYYLLKNLNTSLDMAKNILEREKNKYNKNWKFYVSDRLTEKDILESNKEDIDKYMVSLNPNITIENALKHPEIDWDWYNFSLNPNLTYDDMIKYYTEVDFDDDKLITNPNITMDIVESNTAIMWDVKNFSKNPNCLHPGLNYKHVKDVINETYYLVDIVNNNMMYNDTVFKANYKKDLSLRRKYLKLVFEKLSYFSRNIDKLIIKKINYN